MFYDPIKRGCLEEGSQLNKDALQSLQDSMDRQRKHLRLKQVEKLRDKLFENGEHGSLLFIEQLMAERAIAAKALREVSQILSKMPEVPVYSVYVEYMKQRIDQTMRVID